MYDLSIDRNPDDTFTYTLERNGIPYRENAGRPNFFERAMDRARLSSYFAHLREELENKIAEARVGVTA